MSLYQKYYEEIVCSVPSTPENAVEGARTDGLSIYRNNYRCNLVQALELVYPVLVEMVGVAFFKYLGRRYVSETPSRSGNLHEYGSRFAEFIERQEDCSSYPYLGDIARLEYAIHRFYFSRKREVCWGPIVSVHAIVDLWRAHKTGAVHDISWAYEAKPQEAWVLRIYPNVLWALTKEEVETWLKSNVCTEAI